MAPHLAPHPRNTVKIVLFKKPPWRCCPADRALRSLTEVVGGGQPVSDRPGTRYRILYQRSGNLVVLLHAPEKDTGAVPQADIELARQRMADFRRRMDAIR